MANSRDLSFCSKRNGIPPYAPICESSGNIFSSVLYRNTTNANLYIDQWNAYELEDSWGPHKGMIGSSDKVILHPLGTHIADFTNGTIYVYPCNNCGIGDLLDSQYTGIGFGYGRDIAWSPDGDYIAVGGSSSPYIKVYPWDNTTGFGTVYADPSILPITTECLNVQWSADSQSVIFNGGGVNPNKTAAYPWSVSGFGIRYSPPTGPAWVATFLGSSRMMSISPDGNFVAFYGARNNTSTSPNIAVWGYDSAVGFTIAPQPDPTWDPGPFDSFIGTVQNAFVGNNILNVGWHPDSTAIALSFGGNWGVWPYTPHYGGINIWKWDGGFADLYELPIDVQYQGTEERVWWSKYGEAILISKGPGENLGGSYLYPDRGLTAYAWDSEGGFNVDIDGLGTSYGHYQGWTGAVGGSSDKIYGVY